MIVSMTTGMNRPAKIFLSIVLICTFSISIAQPRIDRVDPPNWWVGMKWNEVQLMVYGEDLAGAVPTVSYDGVSIKRSSSLSNSNYKFIDLAINSSAKPGTVEIDLGDAGKIDFPILEREEGRSNLRGFDNADNIYLITPDRFANGDPGNDNVTGMKERANRDEPCGRHGGDIEGMRKNLDYIKDMGFTAIWLNPLLENDMQDNSYHGYSTTDFYKVDPRYGSNEDYKRLADEAREKGMGIIMDMIVNHIGSEHWWMKDLPADDWLNYPDNYVGTNHRRTTLQDPYASERDKQIFSDGWFVRTMPDLNQRNEYMGIYLIQNAIWWVEYLGLEGIRMDTYPYPDADYMTWWTKAVMDEYPEFSIVGEEWSAMPGQVSFWQRGKKNANGYTSHLTSLMDFPTQQNMVKSLIDPELRWNTWVDLYENLAQDYMYPDPYSLVVFPDNHDMSRIYTQVKENYSWYKMALAYVATMRGVPQIYYGTELLMTDNGDHCIIRTDYPGGWDGDKVNAFTGKGLSKEQKEARDFMTRLLKWRLTNSAVQTGKLTHFNPEQGAYVYFRYDNSSTVMVAMNKNTKEVELDLSKYAEVVPTWTRVKNILTGESMPVGKTMTIHANEVFILEVN